MVVLLVLLNMAVCWFLSFYTSAGKLRTYFFFFFHRTSTRGHNLSTLYPSVTKFPIEGRASKSLVCDFQGALLRSSSPFPFFMLVAFEGGVPVRSFLLLLLSSPFLYVLGPHHELTIRVMAFIAFCGLRKRDVETVARAVLPKFYLENMHLHGYEVLASVGKRVVFTRLPRVMVDGFLRDYLGVEEVVAGDMQVVWGQYYTGFFSDDSLLKQRSAEDLFREGKVDIGLVSSCNPHDKFISHCKEIYVVNKEESSRSSNSGCSSTVLARDKYPKPLIFHDGRLAFLPTPSATTALFLYLPLAIAIAVLRLLIGTVLPYNTHLILAALTGFRLRVEGLPSSFSNTNKNVLFVCNHRTLLDPVILSIGLGRPLTAVTYSLSRMSELISPIRTARLTRNRDEDGRRMEMLLKEGDLVVCPEGTTCREPYLLRFSSLFADLADEMVPVAVETESMVFYGTTASGFKWLDPVFFFMNPRPEYRLRFLGRVPPELTCAGGRTGSEVANGIQRQLGEALGFQCTGFTRRDKYLMLAGNEGVVKQQ